MKTTTMGRALPGLLLAAALVSLPPGVAAQQRTTTPASDTCEEGRVRGSLGITGLTCRDCSFESHNGSMTSARFGTEPVVTGTEDGSLVQPGDVLVALDGHLITTRAGAEAYTQIQPGDRVRVTLRRNGVERELAITAGVRCDRPPPSPRAPATPRTPEPPASPSPAAAPAVVWGPDRVLPAPPAPPALSAVRPDARLGFAFECDRCRYDGEGERWSFESYPVVFGVEAAGPAAGRLRAGDVLVALDGHDLRDAEGGRAFSGLTPGRTARWTVVREGTRVTVETRTEAKAVVPRADPREPMPPLAPAPRPDVEPAALRYAGSVGAARVEVHGDPVTVSRSGDVLIIRTAGNTIRIELRPEG